MPHVDLVECHDFPEHCPQPPGRLSEPWSQHLERHFEQQQLRWRMVITMWKIEDDISLPSSITSTWPSTMEFMASRVFPARSSLTMSPVSYKKRQGPSWPDRMLWVSDCNLRRSGPVNSLCEHWCLVLQLFASHYQGNDEGCHGLLVSSTSQSALPTPYKE